MPGIGNSEQVNVKWVSFIAYLGYLKIITLLSILKFNVFTNSYLICAHLV